MGAGNYNQTSFLGGEWAPSAQGQTDHPRYPTALNRCLNSFPVESGAWTRRPGWRSAGRTRGGAAGRIIPFTFSDFQPYLMEFTDGHLRMNDGHDPVPLFQTVALVSTISGANPAVLTTTAAQTWATDDVIYFEYLDDTARYNVPLLGGRRYKITKLTTTTFALYDEKTGTAIDGAVLAWASSNVRVHKIMDLSTAYGADDLENIVSIQANNNAILLAPGVQPYVLDMLTEPADGVPATFELDAAQFVDGPYLDPVSGSTITASGVTGSVTLTLSFAAWSSTKAYKKGDYVTSGGIGYRALQGNNVNKTPATYVGTYWEVALPGEVVGPDGFTALDVGRHIRLFDSASHWTWGRVTGFSSTGLIDYTTTANAPFGDMTGDGGIAAAVDGVGGLRATTSCASKGLNSGVQESYTGTRFTSGQQVKFASILPSSSGLVTFNLEAGLSLPWYVELYGSTSAPSSSTNGTLLATSPVQTGNGLSQINLVSSDATTAFTYVWVRFVISGMSGGMAGTVFISQMQLFTPSAGASGSVVSFEILGADLASTSTMTTWRLGAYADSVGWPTCGCYHEGRLWLAGGYKNRFDASVSNDIFNFAPTGTTGTVADNNAISYTVNSADQNQFCWLKPDLQGIVGGTLGGEWLITASAANNVLTPTSIQAHQITSYRCAKAEPRRTGLTVVFIQRLKKSIIEYLADAFSGKHYGPNLSKFAKHLFKGGVEEIAYQQELVPTLWARKTDGSLIGATYRRVKMFSSEDAEFFGWHRHTHGASKEIVSIAVGPSTSKDIDALAAVAKRPDTNEHFIEVMAPLFEDEDEITDAQFLDSAVVPCAGKSVTVLGSEYLRLYGLWQHVGLTVDVFVAGLDLGSFTVTTGGYVDIPYTSTFTKSYLIEVADEGADFGDIGVSCDKGAFTIPALVGYSYKSQGQRCRPASEKDSGARAGPPAGKYRRTHQITALLVKTQGISFGTRFSKLTPAKLATEGGTALGADELFSGAYQGTIDDVSSLDSMACWEVSRPFPATLASIGGFLHTQDK